MKIKFIAALMALLLVFQGMAFAEFQFGTVEDVLTVSGTANPYESVAFILLDTDSMGLNSENDPMTATLNAYKAKISEGLTTTEIFNFQRVEADSEGNWSYTMPMTGIETKNLTLLPSAGEAEYIQYASVAYRANIIPILIDAALIDEDTLESKISLNVGYIADRTKQYNKLSNKKTVAKYNKEMIAALNPEDETALTQLKKGIDEAVVVCSVAEGKITDFDDAMSIVDYDAAEKANITSEGTKKVVEILAKKTYETVEKYKEEAKEQFALQQFNYNINEAAGHLVDVLKELDLDLTEFNDLSSSKQAQAAKSLAVKKSESLKDAQDNLDEIVAELKEDSKPSSGGGGIGTGSQTNINENKPHNASGSTSITNEYLEQQKYIYEDLTQASWAVDAVLYLNKEGIINGYEDNSFRPLNPITRAEFTKIIVSTFFIDTNAGDSDYFKDVNGDEWYADYINVAYNAGIVSGDENGNFNPNETISRQDMAVIIYNAGLKFNLFAELADYTQFADDAEIADYAKKAVYTLKNSSIINGIGEGYYAPNANADRASAAKIIYELINNNNK